MLPALGLDAAVALPDARLSVLRVAVRDVGEAMTLRDCELVMGALRHVAADVTQSPEYRLTTINEIVMVVEAMLVEARERRETA